MFKFFKAVIMVIAMVYSAVTANPAPFYAAAHAIETYTSIANVVDLVSSVSQSAAVTVTETVPATLPVEPVPETPTVPVAETPAPTVPVPVVVEQPKPKPLRLVKGPRMICNQGAKELDESIMSGTMQLETAKSSVSCPHCSNWTWISQDGPVRKVRCYKGHESYIYPVKYNCPKCGYSWTTTRKEKLFTVYDCEDCNALR